MRTVLQSVRVRGTDGETSYTITRWSDGSLSCSCRGFQFRKSCRHCTTVEAIVWEGALKDEQLADSVPIQGLGPTA